MAMFAVTGASFAATAKKAPKRAHGSATPKAHSAKPRTGANHTPSRKSRSARPPARRSFQQAPTPERYKEIQQVLADKGYFKGSVDGRWAPDSVDALRRFQADQSLEPDGKLGALSLIALGLGPKRLSAQSTPATPQATIPR